MRVLLTGASGFLGRRVAELVVAGGHDVVSIGRSAPAGPLTQPGRFIKADLTDAGNVKRAASEAGDVDSIIHLAAMVPRNAEQDDAATAFAVNVIGTIHLFGAFGQVGQANIVASTAEVYGLPEGHELLREDTAPRPLTLVWREQGRDRSLLPDARASRPVAHRDPAPHRALRPRRPHPARDPEFRAECGDG